MIYGSVCSGIEAPVGEAGEWQICPKCWGQKVVSRPPQLPADVSMWSGTQASYECDICQGKGILAKPTVESPNPQRAVEQYTREEAKQIAKDCTREFCGLPSEFDKYFDETYPAKTYWAGEISPVLNREDVAAIKGKLKADQDDYLERAEAEGISKTDDFEAGYMACIRRMNGILNIRMKEIPPTPAPEVKEEPEDQWHPQDYSGKNSPAEEGKSI